MTIRQAVFQAEDTLKHANVPDPRIDAELIVSNVTGLDRMNMRLMGATELSQEQEQRFSSLLFSRAQREPLQYLLGVQYFYGRPFRVDSRVLIPRQETESLCELGICYLHTKGKKPCVLDLCTGSGAIAVTLKTQCPFAEVTASDLSADALNVAQENARLNDADVQFVQGDLFAPFVNHRFDLILSNPPYIPTMECDALQAEVRHEPYMALDGGQDGMCFYRRIARQAPVHLYPGGMLAVEVGDHESDAIVRLFEQADFKNVSVYNDLYGMPRMVSGLMKENIDV